jgi:hypothetical protein
MSLCEGVEQDRGEIAIDHRHAVLGAAAIGLLEFVEECLAYGIAFVVLVNADPS